MGANRLRCSDGCEISYDWMTLIHKWGPEFRCEQHRQPMRWFNQWPQPKAAKDTTPIGYEVLFVARLDDHAPNGDLWVDEGYLPVVMVCRDQDNKIKVWPRYWVKPAENVQFGQDGPLLSLVEWDYLMAKVRRFLDRQNGSLQQTS